MYHPHIPIHWLSFNKGHIMDNNIFPIDVTNISSPIIVDLINSASETEGFNRLELVVTANLDADVDINISDNNIKLTSNRFFDADENTMDLVYDLLIQKETPLAQLNLLVDGTSYLVVIKNV